MVNTCPEPVEGVNTKFGGLIMAAEAQIFANRRLGRRIVLNLDHLYLPALRSPQGEGWVSDFDIRISDFNHSGCFMQNKPNLLNTQMNVGFYLTRTYENNLCSGLLENKPNSKPIKPNTNPIHWMLK